MIAIVMINILCRLLLHLLVPLLLMIIINL